MARFRLSTDILSPIHSDISLNDISVFSFESLSGTPDFKKGAELPKDKCFEKDSDSDINSFCTRTMKESADAFDMIVNDIKKQSNINAVKEEKFKESYEMLKHSMDELFYNKVSHTSVLSPLSNDTELENVNETEITTSEIMMDKVTEVPQNLKVLKKTASTKSKTHSQVSSKKSEKNEDSVLIKRKKKSQYQSKNIHPMKESKGNSKQYKNKAHLENETDAKRNDSLLGSQKSKSFKMISSSTQTCELFGAAGIIANDVCEMTEEKRNDNLKNFYLQNQRKIPVLNRMPAIENKRLPIEKSIQIAVGMEMDNMRRFMLDQNLCLRKELFKLQEMAKKQSEVQEYMFSVVDELLDANKKLISKHK